MVNGILPLYLDHLICKHNPSFYSLLFFDANLLFVSCTFSKFSDHKFSVCSPLLWKSLLIN